MEEFSMGQIYEFQARNSHGRRLRGNMEASSQLDLVRKLQNNGYTVTHIKEKNQEIQLFIRKIPLKEMFFLCKQLGTMVRSGVPVIQGLKMIEHQVKYKKLQSILHVVIQDLLNGEDVADAFKKHEAYFPPLFINMLYSAELSGNLEEALFLLANNFQREIEVRRKLKSAFTYPIVIFIFANIVALALILYALPTFIDMFDKANAELPLITKILLAIHGVLIHNWFYLFIGLGVSLFILMQWKSSEEGKRKFDYLLTKIPIINRLLIQAVVYRFGQTLHDLYKSGISIEDGLKVVSKVVNNAYFGDAILQIREEVQNGSDITTAMNKSHLFPDLLVSMVQVGEETGDLETLLKDVAEYNQKELEQSVNQFTSVIEPLLLIFIGLMIGGIIMGILLPMYGGITMVGS